MHNLPSGHLIATMVTEHDVLLGFLRELDELRTDICGANALVEGQIRNLARLSQGLVDAEPHHQREEQVLFPALEALGINGPPQMMREEHTLLRKAKHELLHLAQNPGAISFAAFQNRVSQLVDELVQSLRAHIQKENQILYPMALAQISPGQWGAMQTVADAIGPCSFTPQQ